MPNINELLDLPEPTITQILSIDSDELHIEGYPVHYIQCCPICQSQENVIRKGYKDPQVVRHLAVFDKKTHLHVPSIRMFCSSCHVSFTWAYEFVGPKRRYSHRFRAQTVEYVWGSHRRISPGCSKLLSALYSRCIMRRFQ
ncbi:transposase family protein [Paenibacillus thiaminolyticus]